ncbi:MAG: hypothetical protein IKM11_04895 [Oscillospiraceae bacterium]|nr:hypothetical protein [Oscillospiraceae bacterium]
MTTTKAIRETSSSQSIRKLTYSALFTALAMVLGRIVWGGVQFAIAGLQHSTFTPALFLAGAVTSAIPGIILQIVLIPLIIMALERAGLVLNHK